MQADLLLVESGLTAEAALPVSECHFIDRAHFRVEIPSVEGPRVFAAVLHEAEGRSVTVNRVSQGSGAMLLSTGELREMARIGADAGIEVSLFVGPRESWSVYASARSAESNAGGNVRGLRQLRYAIEDVLRAVECGIRGFLVADAGLLCTLREGQAAGLVPSDVVWKWSAMAAPSNPAALRVIAEMGASTVNLPIDLTLAELAEMRSVTTLPLDLYVEGPESMGGIVRGEQLGDIVVTTAPLYAKFGLRNSRPLYPSGLHLENDAELLGRERVRRAQVALEWLDRSGLQLVQSEPGAQGLGIPQP